MANRQSIRSLKIRGPKSNRSPTYKSWMNMKARCNNKNVPGFHRYGGAGISVCERWKSFEAFYEDMGPRPEGHTLDRIDSSDGYHPGNCRWATPLQQSQNTRAVKKLANGLCQREAARKYGISESTLRHRLSLGWELNDALTRKPHPNNDHN